jgi:outer membrane protein OmpA-like peptidoglycan-associated protein
MGTGIVIAPEKTNSTVKIIEATLPVTVGTRLVLLKGAKKELPGPDLKKDEKLPIIETLEGTEPGKQVHALTLKVLFDFNDSVLKDEYKAEIEKIKEFIADYPNYEVVLKGYCCSIGGVEYNLKLSQQRVEGVKQYLVETLKIKAEDIEANYYGETGAPCDNSTEEERQKNRLVQIEVIER